MGFFGEQPQAKGLSKPASAILHDMLNSGDSQVVGVAEILDTIAQNGDGQEVDEWLIVCAGEVRDAAQAFIDRLEEAVRKGRGGKKAA